MTSFDNEDLQIALRAEYRSLVEQCRLLGLADIHIQHALGVSNGSIYRRLTGSALRREHVLALRSVLAEAQAEVGEIPF